MPTFFNSKKQPQREDGEIEAEEQENGKINISAYNIKFSNEKERREVR